MLKLHKNEIHANSKCQDFQFSESKHTLFAYEIWPTETTRKKLHVGDPKLQFIRNSNLTRKIMLFEKYTINWPECEQKIFTKSKLQNGKKKVILLTAFKCRLQFTMPFSVDGFVCGWAKTKQTDVSTQSKLNKWNV